MADAPSSRKLLFFIPEDWYVCTHRLPLIRGARDLGLDVVVVTRVGREAGPIREAGARVVPTRLRRGFRNPLRDFGGLVQLVRIYRRERPDLVHHVTPKSCLYGSLAAVLAGVPRVINAMAGLGFLYASADWKARLVRPLVAAAFRWLLTRPGSRMIVQNGDDEAFFRDELGVPAERIAVIRGSGVDTGVFHPAAAPPPGPLRLCLAARLIREKGLYETVAAARILRERGRTVEIVFAGEPDRENPSGVSDAQLQAWQDEGLITWLGRVGNVAEVLRTCHVGLLPSFYREGLPKSLLEAAATGLPLISTDTVGCREICRPGVNGLFVPVRDAAALADAIARLDDDPELRAAYGRESRRLAETLFAEEIVVGATMDLYREMLPDGD